MPDLSQAESALADALKHLARLHSTVDSDGVEMLQAELDAAREALRALTIGLRAIAHPVHVHGTSLDVRSRAIFEHALDAILVADDSGRYVDANPAACKLLGYSRQELLQRSVTDVTPAAQRELVPQLWREFLAAGSMSGEYQVQTCAGELAQVEFRAVANIVPGEHLSILRDVTKLRTAQRALHDLPDAHARAAAVRALHESLDELFAIRLDLARQERGDEPSASAEARRGADELDQTMARVRSALRTLTTLAAGGTEEGS